MLAAPAQVTSRWLGAENARQPAVEDLARGLAARDIALGLAALSALGDERVGAHLQVACAIADAGDVLGTLAARRHLPRGGMLATVAVAGAATLAELALARDLARG